jgi:hypothetical protein
MVGKIMYVPQSLLDEAELIRQKKGCRTRYDAFEEIVSYSMVGRETEKVFNTFNLFGPLPKRKK